MSSIVEAANTRFSTKTYATLKLMFGREGFKGLFRGLIPSLLGIAPTRAIYFATYSTTKDFLVKRFKSESSLVHLMSGAMAGWVVYTTMNPVYMVKTRIQLQEVGRTHKSVPNYSGYLDCIKKIYMEEGLKGFWKGLTASYLGIFESIIYFGIYEKMKKEISDRKLRKNPDAKSSIYIIFYLSINQFRSIECNRVFSLCFWMQVDCKCINLST